MCLLRNVYHKVVASGEREKKLPNFDILFDFVSVQFESYDSDSHFCDSTEVLITNISVFVQKEKYQKKKKLTVENF